MCRYAALDCGTPSQRPGPPSLNAAVSSLFERQESRQKVLAHDPVHLRGPPRREQLRRAVDVPGQWVVQSHSEGPAQILGDEARVQLAGQWKGRVGPGR